MLKAAVYDLIDPKITPVFEELLVHEGIGHMLRMQIHPSMPPYTDSAGKGTIRICGKSVSAAGLAMNISMRVSIDSRIESVLCDFAYGCS